MTFQTGVQSLRAEMLLTGSTLHRVSRIIFMNLYTQNFAEFEEAFDDFH